MSYESTVAIIRSTANAVNDTGMFLHGRKIDASEKYDGMFPMIVLYPFTRRRATDPDFIDNSDILMGFLAQDKPDSSPEEREALVIQMDELSEAFLDLLGENDLSRVSNVVKEPQFQVYSGKMSGYAIRFTFQDFTPCEDDI